MKLDSAVFYTKNIDLLKPFYVEFLGLKIVSETPYKYISFVFKNGIKLGIKVGDKPREIGGHGTIFVSVENIETWFEKARTSQQNIYKQLVKQNWGTSFSILDPDENKIEFVQYA